MILYAIALELTVVLAFWLCLAALQRSRATPGRWPPYGRHRILTEEEIDLVVDFIHTL